MALEREPGQSERELLDTVERAGRLPAGRSAVHLHLSQLLPIHRKPSHLRIAARMFAPLEVSHNLQVFPLSGGDIFVLGRDMPEDEVDRIVHRLRSLFADDPLAYAEFDADDDPFVTWYALEVDLDELLAVVRALLDTAEIRRRDRRLAEQRPPEPLAPADLDGLVARLEQFPVRAALRRQPALRILPRREAEILFEEFHLAMADIRDAIAPDRDLFADRWLFQEFSRSLDRVLLATLPQTEVFAKPPTISLNLNLETLETREFLQLAERLATTPGGGRRLVVEVQVIDVFTNLGRFQKAGERLRATGNALLIDGLSPSALGAMDLKLLAPDYVKILWSPDLGAVRHARKAAELGDLVHDLGAERVILSRCDSEQAVTWGLGHGITAFQGRFMDVMLGSVTMQQCPQAACCTLRDCVARRGSVAGRRRGECPHPPGLDAVHRFTAPRARRRLPGQEEG